MPTYEYRCPEGHQFELFQKMSDEPRAECPECGATSERMLSGGAGFLFKGDGFYITDYRSDSYKKDASKETSGAESKKAASSVPEAGAGATSSPKKPNESKAGPSSGGSTSKES